jgi:peptidoglycan hydrolase CwlO-like protein
VALLGAPQFSRASTSLSAAIDERQQQLQDQLDSIEKEIQEQQKYLDAKQQEGASLQRDLDIFDGQIKKSQLDIQATTYSIQKLGTQIGNKQQTIQELDGKFLRQKESLAQLIRATNQIDGSSLAEIALSKKNISDFFADLGALDTVTVSLEGSFKDIVDTKTQTADEKAALEDTQAQQQELKNIQVLEQKKIQDKKAQKKLVLDVTKGQEALYQQVIAQKQQTASQIRAELFKLRGSSAISLGDAIDYATNVEEKTGVRAALILGTLQEETKLGENLGTGNWQTDSHPTRDRWIFGILMKNLGLDPDKMPVSAKPWYGWGGAMGPAQFIPSTWVLYAGYECNASAQTCTYTSGKDRIGSLTGHHPPNPYDPQDAFMAAGVLLADNGATAGTRAAERLASLRYFAGWTNANKAAYAFYGDDVISFADGYQTQINILKNG